MTTPYNATKDITEQDIVLQNYRRLQGEAKLRMVKEPVKTGWWERILKLIK